ncbi:MAG: DUF2165 domain-containing protein [Candidatus Xenobia bacterium]
MASESAHRVLKTLLLGCVALYFSLVVLNNVTAWQVNYAFVQHTMTMDTTFPGNPLTWRAVHSPALHRVAYVAIIAYETACAIFTSMATIAYAKCIRLPQHEPSARRLATNALLFGLLLWLGGFMTIAGEWFTMWQSQTWNGLDTAFRNFVCQAVVLFYLNLSRSDAVT